MWHDLGFTADEARATLGAMRRVLGPTRTLEPREIELLEVAANIVGHPQAAADVEPLEPVEVARLVTAPRVRQRIVESAILASLMDGVVDPEEAESVCALAASLDVDEPRLAALCHLARGRTALAWLDLARRSFAKDAFERALAEGGLRSLYEIVAPLVGLGDDPALAARYIALGEHDPGTLGRAYFDFLVRNELPFPGEHRAVPEAGVWHDLTHVLSGYETTDQEEILVVSFIAGYRREDPFFWIFTIALQYHLGIKVSPYSPARRGLFHPATAMAAYERGTHVVTDLERWEPWPHFARPLADVRRELGVPPPERGRR